MNCDVCGKETEDENGTNILGISVQVLKSGYIEVQEDFVQKQLGPYKLGKTYGVCYECLLRALGVKP